MTGFFLVKKKKKKKEKTPAAILKGLGMLMRNQDASDATVFEIVRGDKGKNTFRPTVEGGSRETSGRFKGVNQTGESELREIDLSLFDGDNPNG